MRRHWLFVAVLWLLLAVLFAPRLLVAPQLSRRLGGQLQDHFDAEKAEVRLGASLGWELFFGRIPALDIVVENAKVDGLGITRAEFAGRDIRFDLGSFLRTGQFVYEGASQLGGTLTVTEGALNEIYWLKADPDRNMRLKIEPGNLILAGEISLWAARLDVELRGVLEIWGQSGLRLVLQNLEVERTRVPPLLLEVLNQNYDFALDLSVLPEPAAIRAIDLQQGKMLIDIGVVR